MRTFLLTLLLFAPGAASPQDDATTVEPIVLKDVLWQILPDRVRNVFVGPDQRLWFCVGQGFGKIDRATARKVIETEFTKELPCLPWLEPVLFEPGGRVWFAGPRRNLLLGYDGREWVERTAKNGFIGNCPGHGRVWHDAYNLSVAGVAFFHDYQGIHCFDGKTWIYRQWYEGPYDPNRRASLYVEPDGEGVVAVIPGKRSAVWRWRKGEWREIRKDFAFEGQVVPSPDNGLWIFRDNERMESLGYDDNSETRDALIAQVLEAKSADARNRAVEALVRCGSGIRPKIEQALAKTYDPDALAALTGAMERLAKPAGPIILGPYTADAVSLLHYDEPSGRIFVAAKGLRSSKESLGAGLLIVENARYRFFPGEEIVEKWGTNYSEDPGPIVSADGKSVLIRGRLLNLESGTFVGEIPDQLFSWTHALRNDGTAVVGSRAVGQPGVVNGIHRPGRPDERRFLDAVTETRIDRNSGELFTIAPDGAIWAPLEGKGLSRFDGNGWSVPPGIEKLGGASILRFTVGDAVALSSYGGYALLRPDGATSYNSLEALIQENIATIRGGGMKRMRFGSRGEPHIAVDTAGNVWFLKDRQHVKVYVGDRWIDGRTILMEAGSRGWIEYLGPVGNGERIFLTDFSMRHDHGRSFFGEVKNGKLVFTESPHIMERDLTELGVQDLQGGTWLPGTIGHANRTSDSYTGQLAVRVTGDGKVEQIKNVGWAKLCDAKGNIWLGNIWGKPDSCFNLWREGKVVRQIDIPSINERTQLHADADGRVYARTMAGIHLLACDDPADPTSFRIEEVYTPRGVRGYSDVFAVSPLGYLVVGGWSSENDVYTHTLHLIKLPSSK